ncbi:MAG: ABC transporter substrate-binding protein [Proteobacteria bacterium]|nr:ABC transporter substrate-binding protein [Pseudomonadota bacterium]
MNYGLLFKALVICVPLAIGGCGQQDSGTNTGASGTDGVIVDVSDAKAQFVPVLSYRTGPYAPNGTPVANGFTDYLKLINARDGGINGVKISFEECETGYATDRSIECYERLKGQGPTGAAVFNPMSTGATFAITEKAPVDKIPLITMGYGRSESRNGGVFPWNFPIYGTYWTAADILITHLGNINGGLNKLKGKKIALVYHDSPFGKEPIPLLEKRASMLGFKLLTIPVTHPGVEQKSAWINIRKEQPDYVLLWGWGVMNSTAIKEATGVLYPRDQMYGVWWAGSEPDVRPAAADAVGYQAVSMVSSGQAQVHKDILSYLYDKGLGSGEREGVGEVLYNVAVINAALVVESIRTAQSKYGEKPLTGEEVRWGIENLNITAEAIEALGLTGYLYPLNLSCSDHEGKRMARLHRWNGESWEYSTDWISADDGVIKPMVKSASDAYAKQVGLPTIACSS